MNEARKTSAQPVAAPDEAAAFARLRRLALPFVLIMVALTALLGWYVAGNLRMNTDPGDMLARNLPFRVAWEKYKAAFPEVARSNLAIVLDGANPDLVEDGAARLAARLRAEPTLFEGVFYPQGNDYFRRSGLLYLSETELTDLSARLAEAQPMLAVLARDPTLRGLFEVLGLANEGIRKDESVNVAAVSPALDAISAVIESRAKGGAERLSWIRLLRDKPLKPADLRRIIVLRAARDFNELQPGKRAMSEVRRLAAELGLTPENGVRVRLTGELALDTEELRSVETGASRAALVSLVLVAGLLVWGLRSIRLVASVLVLLVTVLVWTAAFATVAVGELNLVSVAFAVLSIGLGVDFGIHVALRYREALAQTAGQAVALRLALKDMRVALFLAAATTAIAFLSFVPTDYRGISELGVIAAASMVLAFVFSMTLLPALIALMPVAKRQSWSAGRLAAASHGFIHRHAGAICGVALMLGIAAAGVAPLMHFDHNPLNLKDTGTESVRTVLELMDEPQTAPFTASVLAPDREAAEALAARLKALPLVDKAVTIADFVPEGQEAKLAVIADTKLFLSTVFAEGEKKPAPAPAEQRAAFKTLQQDLAATLATGKAGALEPKLKRLAAALALFADATKLSDAALASLDRALVGTLPGRLEELRLSLGAKRVVVADLPPAVRDRQIATDGRVRVEIFPKEDLTSNANLRAFVAAIHAVAPGAVGPPVNILAGGEVVVSAFFQATGLAVIAIVVLLAVLLRRFWDVVLVVLPLLLAAMLTVAVAYLVGVRFNLANIIVLPLLLGLGVDSGIHLVRRARGDARTDLAQTSTPRAVMFSALTTFGSFGTLALSSHRGTASMGILLAIAIAMTLFAALVVLPALMSWRERRTGDPR